MRSRRKRTAILNFILKLCSPPLRRLNLTVKNLIGDMQVRHLRHGSSLCGRFRYRSCSADTARVNPPAAKPLLVLSLRYTRLRCRRSAYGVLKSDFVATTRMFDRLMGFCLGSEFLGFADDVCLETLAVSVAARCIAYRRSLKFYHNGARVWRSVALSHALGRASICSRRDDGARQSV